MYPQTRKDLAQGLKIDRLGDEAIASRIVDSLGILKGTIPGDGYDQHVGKVFLLARPMNQRETVLAAQMNVQQYRFRQGLRRNEYECRFESVSEYGVKPFFFQPPAQEFAKQRIIFNNQNAMLHLLP